MFVYPWQQTTSRLGATALAEWWRWQHSAPSGIDSGAAPAGLVPVRRSGAVKTSVKPASVKRSLVQHQHQREAKSLSVKRVHAGQDQASPRQQQESHSERHLATSGKLNNTFQPGM